MSTETILTFLEECTPERRLGFQVVSQCAPVLKGIKASNLITIKTGTCHQVMEGLQGSRIKGVRLHQNREKEVLFLYRSELLEQHLGNEEAAMFLRRCGYHSLEIDYVLERMKGRYEQYADAGKSFPHELGVLLEYPVHDVREFIRNKGRNSLVAKYWKVYHNTESALDVFSKYDQARETALGEIIQGYPLVQVAVS